MMHQRNILKEYKDEEYEIGGVNKRLIKEQEAMGFNVKH